MEKKSRRKFSSAFKSKVALEAAKALKTINDTCIYVQSLICLLEKFFPGEFQTAWTQPFVLKY